MIAPHDGHEIARTTTGAGGSSAPVSSDRRASVSLRVHSLVVEVDSMSD